jgi:hypothetical protein
MFGTIAALAAVAVSAIVALVVVIGATSGVGSAATTTFVAVLGVSVIAGAIAFFVWDQHTINWVHRQIAALLHN